MKRYTASRKLQIVRDYEEGKDISAAMAENMISQEELDGWVKGFSCAGLQGLKATKFQDVRKMGAM